MNRAATIGAMEKSKRMATVMATGIGYFKAKQTLQEHDWNAEEAIASINASSTKEAEAAAGTTPNETLSQQNSHTNVRSLKQVSPHSNQHYDTAAEALPRTTSGASHPQPLDDRDWRSTALSVQQDDDMDNVSLDDDEEAPPPSNNMQEYIEKREDEAYNNYPSIVSTPSAFWRNAAPSIVSTPSSCVREDSESNIAPGKSVSELQEERSIASADLPAVAEDEDKPVVLKSYFSTFWRNAPSIVSTPSAVREDSDSPNIAARTSVPELQEEPSISSAVTYPKLDVPAVGEDKDKPVVTKSYGWKQRLLTSKRLWAVGILLFVLITVLSVSIGVAQSQTNKNSEPLVSGTGEAPSTTAASHPSTTLAPPVSSVGTTGQESFATTPTTLSPTTAATTLKPTDPPTETPKPVTQAPTTPPATPAEPTSPQPLSVEGAKMILRGAPSHLDQDAIDAWSTVTNDFLVKYVQQVISEKTDDGSTVNVQVALTSQTEGNNNRLSIVFSVTFEIASTLTSHNVKKYVRRALGRKNEDEYIQKLQETDSSFQDVFDINVSV